MFKKILNKAVKTNNLNIEEIMFLLKVEEKNFKVLCSIANRVRQEYLGNNVHMRGIIEFSNYCSRSCKYCGLRKENKELERYRIELDEIINLGIYAGKIGYKTIVLQSGEDNYEADKIEYITKKLKKEADVAVTLSLGERDFAEYKLWKKAGADRYLLKHEIADKDKYNNLHPGMSYEERIKRLRWLKELGYQTGSGNIIGLPEQNEETIAQDIELFKDLDLEMIGIGPLIAHGRTPLKNVENGSVKMTLKTMAITRLLLPQAFLPSTTALNSLDSRGRQKGLQAGANVIMPNITPPEYRSLYEIYPGKRPPEGKIKNEYIETKTMIESLGRKVASGYGHIKKD